MAMKSEIINLSQGWASKEWWNDIEGGYRLFDSGLF